MFVAEPSDPWSDVSAFPATTAATAAEAVPRGSAAHDAPGPEDVSFWWWWAEEPGPQSSTVVPEDQPGHDGRWGHGQSTPAAAAAAAGK